ncbi:MAG: phosphate acetyltransferase [Pseudomonadota bacterium]
MTALALGQQATVTRTFEADDLASYRRLGGGDAQRETVPEPLIGALFSYLLGVELPGQGTMYLKQDTHYERSAAVGRAVTAKVTITALRPDKHLVDLDTECHDAQSGERICRGRALVRYDAL